MKKKIQQYLAMAIFMLIGAACGILMVQYIEAIFGEGALPGAMICSFAGLFLAMYVVIYAQIIIHEAGHLVFGALSGYRFSSFRIMSLMWVKEEGRIQLRRFSMAGTGGQCLMVPPEMKNGKIPVMLYNLGGSLMNVIAGIFGIGLYLILPRPSFLTAVLLMFGVIGFLFAVMNGVPMRMGTVDNDGYNAFSLGKNPDALRSFWIQMKINEQISRGIRLKDMPGEWFAVPSDQEMKNSMVAALGVFACNRLMDQGRFGEADALMAHMLEIDSGMVGIHRNLLICDRIYCCLISEDPREDLDRMYDKEQKKFMKSMKNFLTVIRTEYVYALLAEKDERKAEGLRQRFDKYARSYPYPSEVQGERELIEVAEKKQEKVTA